MYSSSDQLGGVGVNVAENDMVILTLQGLLKIWDNYQDLVKGKEKLPNWERLWSHLVQEEISWNTIDGTSFKGEDGENFAMVGKGKKGKGKKSQTKPKSNQGGKKKYFSKIKCFSCHEFGHYATKCPHKNSSKKNSRGEVGEAFASLFELYFTLITCMSNTMMGSLWYLDSNALFHMTGCRKVFNDLKEKDLHMHIEFGHNGRYSYIGIGTITF